MEKYNGSLPTLEYHPYSFTKVCRCCNLLLNQCILASSSDLCLTNLKLNMAMQIASIIFIDSPTFTGFSYSNSTDDHITGNSKNFEEDYVFLKKVHIYIYINMHLQANICASSKCITIRIDDKSWKILVKKEHL